MIWALFVLDYNSGADPMKQASSQVAKYWRKQRQAVLLAVLKGIYIADDGEDAWDERQKNTYSIATAGGRPWPTRTRLGLPQRATLFRKP